MARSDNQTTLRRIVEALEAGRETAECDARAFARALRISLDLDLEGDTDRASVVRVELKPERYVLIKLAAVVTGLTESAIRSKITEKVWLERKEWIRGPDNRIYIDLEGYRRWVVKGRA